MDFPKIIKHKDLTIKLFNWMEYPRGKAAANVEAYNSEGDKLWTISPLGGNPSTDCYTNISTDGNTLKAFNFQCYSCIINEKSGEVISSEFTK